MNNKAIIAIVIIAILVVAGFIIYNGGPVVSATGTSDLKVSPDIVSVNINIQSINDTAQDAQVEVNRVSEDLLVQLIKIGFNRDELKFVNANVNPSYDWRTGKSNGFTASQQLVVKTNSTSEVPSIVDAAISAGALVSYIDFELSDAKQNDYKSQALKAASEDARSKAGAIASGQGKSLGRLVSITNQPANYPGPIMYYSSAANAGGDMMAANAEASKAAVNLTPQDIDISATIQAQYKLSLF